MFSPGPRQAREAADACAEPKSATEVCAAPPVFLKILTIVFRYGAQHRQDRCARANPLLNSEQKKSGSALLLNRTADSLPSELLRDHVRRTRKRGYDFSSGQRRFGSERSLGSPLMDVAARKLPYAAQVPRCGRFIWPLRSVRVATTGRELGGSAGAQREIHTRKDRGASAAPNDIAIKNACGQPHRPLETSADKAPRRSHVFDAAGCESRLSFLN